MRWRRFFVSACCATLLVSAAIGQGSRTIAHLDGHPDEAVRMEGACTWVHGEKQYLEGNGALRVAPSPSDAYYGVRLSNVPARAPKSLRFSLFQEGTEAVRYLIKLEDSKSGRADDDAGWLDQESNPGKWIEVDVDLAALPNRTNTRKLDFRDGIVFFRVSRKRDVEPKAAFIIDDIRLIGETDARDLASEVGDLVKPKDRDDDPELRAKSLREKLPMLPEPERLKAALAGLAKNAHEGIRCACREALASLGDEESVKGLLAALAKERGPARLELLWALASMPSRKARTEAIRLVGDAKTAWPERTALLQGLPLRGAEDVAGLAGTCSPEKPWPQRAALIQSLRIAGTPPCVDALIGVLERPSTARIQSDAMAALVSITGNDLGANASAWRQWWKVQRERGSGSPGSSAPAPKSYASFFGVPVTAGRMVFLLDLSGSMRDPVKGGKAGEYIRRARHLEGASIESRLDLAKAEMANTLRDVPEGSSIAVIAFNKDLEWLTKNGDLEPADAGLKERVIKRLESLKAEYKTNIHDAMAAAFEGSRRSGTPDWQAGPDTIFLLSDGAPSEGPIKDWQTLRDAVLRWNLGRMIRIHVINLGDERRSHGFAVWCRTSGGSFQDLSSEKTSDPADSGRGPKR